MSVPWATTNPAAYASPPSTRTTSRAASSDGRRDSSDADSSDYDGPPRITGDDDDSDVELMSALNAGAAGGVGGRMRAGSSQPRSFAASGAGSDSDSDIPPPPMPMPPANQQAFTTPTKSNGAAATAGEHLHTRRKSAMNIFDSEIAQSVSDLQQRLEKDGPMSPSEQLAAAGGRGASASISGGSSSGSSVPPSPQSLNPASRSVSALSPPSQSSNLQGGNSGSLHPMLQRRGSDFRQRVGSAAPPPNAILGALSPLSANSSSKQCGFSGCLSFSARNGYCLRHVWRLSVEELEPVNQKQYQVAKELVTTEKSYCDGLRVAFKSFLFRITTMSELDPSKPLLSADELSKIFHNIEDLYKLSENLYGDLEELLGEKVLTASIGATLLHYAPQFRIYQTYLENYDEALRTLGDVRKSRVDFDFFCRLQEKCEGMSLESFLIMPVQRLPRYLLLLTELIKRSESGTLVPQDSLADMIAAKEKISHIAAAINLSLHQKESQIKVKAIQDRFERDSRYQDLVTPTRYLVREGPLKKRFSKGTRHLSSSTVYHFFLFSDILVYADFSKAVLGKGVTYKLKHMLPIADMIVEPTSSAKGKNKDISVTTKSGGVVRSFDLSCADTADRDSWLAAFKSAVQKLSDDAKSLKSTSFDGSNQSDKASKSQKFKAMMGV